MNTAVTPAPRSRAKLAAGVTLAVVAIGAVAFGLVRELAKSRLSDQSRASPAKVQPVAAEGLTTPAAALVTTVYYFHGENRCETCLLIEKQASEIVQTAFAGEIAEGRLRFLAVDYDKAEHRHFRDDFKLAFGSVVVSRGARYENLSDVWTLVHEERSQFDAYVVDRVSRFVKATP